MNKTPLTRLNKRNPVSKQQNDTQFIASSVASDEGDTTLVKAEVPKALRDEYKANRLRKGKPIIIEPDEEKPPTNIEDDWGEEQLIAEEAEEQKQKKAKITRRIIQSVVVLGCIYFLILIYGVISTQYVYDENGNVVAETLTVKQIAQQQEFQSIATIYRRARSIYEKVLDLDYAYYAGTTDYLLLGPEYEKVRDSITDLHSDLEAVSPDSQYTQVYVVLTVWIENELDPYCHIMSEALSLGDSNGLKSGDTYRDTMYADFLIISQNLYTLGKNTHGVNVVDIHEWSPESYIESKYGLILS